MLRLCSKILFYDVVAMLLYSMHLFRDSTSKGSSSVEEREDSERKDDKQDGM